MHILQIKIKPHHDGIFSEDQVLDLSGSGLLPSVWAGGDMTPLDILCPALYGQHVPRSGKDCRLSSDEGPREWGTEISFMVGKDSASPERYRALCHLYRSEEGLALGSRTLRRFSGTEEQDVFLSVGHVAGLSFEDFLGSVRLRPDAFSELLRARPEARALLLDALLGEGLDACAASLAYRKFRSIKDERRARGIPSNELPEREAEARRRELSETLRQLRQRTQSGERPPSFPVGASDPDQAERALQELERRRMDWEKEMALFAPDRRRLDQARHALELGEAHLTLSALRREQDRDKQEQTSLNTDLSRYRDEAQSAEETFGLAEAALRDRLVARKKLTDTIRTVRELDQQAQDRQDAALETRGQLHSMESALAGVTVKAEQEQAVLEKLGIALRDVRKYLQTNPSDAKLATGLEGIRKCFDLFSRAQENRKTLKEGYDRALQRKQDAQNALNDRQEMFSDVTHRFGIVEKNYERAQAFFGGSLKGKPIEEWREICTVNERRLQDVEYLMEALHREREVQDEMRQLLDRRLKLENTQRELGMKEADQAARIDRGEETLRQLEHRVELLRRVEAMGDDARQLLQESAPCPLCGAVSHPYAGGMLPNSDELRQQHLDAVKELQVLREEFTARQVQFERIQEEILSAGNAEKELRRELEALNEPITEGVTALGLKIGIGVSPLEELARARQRAREQLQRARDVLSSAEQAERELTAAKDDLGRIRGSQEELTRFHQEALSDLKQAQGETERLEKEIRSHEESFNSVRRELIGQLSLFGYKNLPDENPRQLLELLDARALIWARKAEEKEGLERALCAAQASLQALLKEKEGLKAEAASKADRIKRLEAERDALHQQRVILFASKDPQSEEARMEASLEEARRQLEQRREVRNEARERLESVELRLHELETALATRRDRLQKEEIAFGKSLLAKGFRNEDDYLSACLSEDERKALQERLRDLSRTGLEIGGAQDEARFARAELRSRLAAGDQGGTADLPELLERAGALYLELGADAEAERLFREYGDTFPRNSRSGTELRDYVRDLSFEAILRGANARLAQGGISYRLFREEKSFGLILHDDGGRELSLSGVRLSGSEERTASLALAWGLCDLFCQRSGGTNLRVLELPRDADGAEASRLAEALCGEEECVWIQKY